jgi:tetratricopeptide (TPR) repeat protein
MTPLAQTDEAITPRDWYEIATIYAHNKAWGKAARFFAWAAEGEFEAAGVITQGYIDSQIGLAMAQTKGGKTDAATLTISRIMEVSPTLQPYAFNVNGVLQEELRQWVLAETDFKTAISLQPNNPVFGINLAHLYHVLGRFPEAEAAYDAVVKLDPTNLEARFYRSLALLAQGKFKEGFQEYELRYATAPSPVPMNGKPTWRGEQDLTGKTILMCAEQGIGDSIMCVRYARWLKKFQKAASVIVLAKPDLSKLLDFTNDVDFCVADPKEAEPYDFNVPMMSLPGLSLDQYGSIFYGPDQYIMVQYNKRFDIEATSPRVGFCWKGQPAHGNDKFRSIDPQLYNPLLAMDITPVSLQYKALHGRMLDLGIDSLYDLAQAIQELDLVITVDTSIAHIAGSLGVRTWVMLSPGADFRWQLGSDDTPWYPSVRLFRAAKPLEWEDTIRHLANELEKLIGGVA